MNFLKKYVVFVSRSDFPEGPLQLLREKCCVEQWNKHGPIPRDELLKNVKGRDALFCMVTEKIDAELLDAAGPTLKVIATWSVGSDHIDISECKKRNVLVGHTPDVLTDAVAELTVGLLLATCRRMFESSREITNGGWRANLYGPLWMCGSGLKNSNVGIVGMGRIGFGVLERLQAFKIKQSFYCSRTPKPQAEKLGARKVDFETLLTSSDFVICCCPLTNETKNLFNERAFGLMKPHAIFINTSRGGLVDQDALVEALSKGSIRAAGLDVMTPEPLPEDHILSKLPNCVLLPHVGSATTETRTEMTVLTVQNILNGLEGKPLPAPLWT